MAKIFKEGSKEFFQEFDNNIIVGNSNSISDSGYGKYIDSFDSVVRLNDAKVEGYEKDVGEKETFRVLNKVLQKGDKIPGSNTSKSYVENLEERNLILYPSHESFEESFKDNVDHSNRLFIVSEDFKDYIEDLCDYYSIEKISTGLFSTILFVHIFGKSILINFDFYDDSEESYHYWENFTGGDLSSHDFDKEIDCIEELIKGSVVEVVRL